ncbi:hypothetical protein LXL04_033205 [Taraxacum kok-saghyz]
MITIHQRSFAVGHVETYVFQVLIHPPLKNPHLHPVQVQPLGFLQSVSPSVGSWIFLQSISRHFNWNRYSTHELHKPKAAAESASEPDLPKRTPVAGARVHFRHWYLIVISANSLKLYCISFVSSISTTSGVCFHHLSHCCSSADFGDG